MTIRISYSSSNTLQGCQRKFYHEKIAKTDHDPDFEDNSHALRTGKAFHEILEHSLHGRKKISKETINEVFASQDILDPTDQGLILGMVRKYLQLHSKSGLEVVGVEPQIGDGVDYIGFVDAIMVDSNMNWWIVDLKTAAMLNNSLLSRLSKDPQLNIYAYFKSFLAEKYDLDVHKFAGVRYRVTTKARIKKNKKETFAEFVDRIADRVESYDIGIPASDLDPIGAYERLMSHLKVARSLESRDEEDIPQNFGYCESYFKPCPYWSDCYGSTFSEAGNKYTIYDSANIKHLGMESSVEFDDLEDL